MSVSMNQMLNELSNHQGRQHGISADLLSRRLGVSPRKLRKLISAAREAGTAVCGHPATGYFVAVTPAELEESCRFLEHRALHSLLVMSRMKGVSMPALMGQLMLNQG